MTGKLMKMKIFIAALVILASAGCASAPANEIPNTPESEYVEIEVSESNSAPVVNTDSDNTDEKEVISETDLVNDEQQVVDEIDVTLDDLTSYQLELFKVTSTSFIEDVKEGTMTVEEMAESQSSIFDTYIKMNELPQNARQLFNEWKDDVGYYEKLTAWINDTDTVSTDDIEVTQQTNKPQSSESQVKEQAKDAQERVSGTTTDNSNETVWIDPVTGEVDTHMHSSEEVTGLSFEDTLIRAIMAQEGLSYEEAKALAQAEMAAANSGN